MAQDGCEAIDDNSISERMEKQGYIYDFDMCRWVHESNVYDKTGFNTSFLSIPPFGVTDKRLYEVSGEERTGCNETIFGNG